MAPRALANPTRRTSNRCGFRAEPPGVFGGSDLRESCCRAVRLSNPVKRAVKVVWPQLTGLCASLKLPVGRKLRAHRHHHASSFGIIDKTGGLWRGVELRAQGSPCATPNSPSLARPHAARTSPCCGTDWPLGVRSWLRARMMGRRALRCGARAAERRTRGLWRQAAEGGCPGLASDAALLASWGADRKVEGGCCQYPPSKGAR
jgi:hypothetical protein